MDFTTRLLRLMEFIPDQRQQKETAYHEAGHAVACYVLNHPCEKADIIQGEGYLGRLYMKAIPEDLKDKLREQENLSPCEENLLYNHIIIRFAGCASAYHFTGKPNWEGCSTDLIQASLLIPHLDRSRKEYKEKAKELIDSNWKNVEAVAQALLEKQTLTAQQVHEICERIID